MNRVFRASMRTKTTAENQVNANSPERTTGDENELGAILKFERLLSDLSATFVNLPSDQVDQEIERWMGRIGAFLNMKVGTLAQHSEDQQRARFTHAWAADGIEKLPAR
ncbi:MAG: hypothetical protein ACP5U1_00145, partial [Desulfomonilaceae bacterium]